MAEKIDDHLYLNYAKLCRFCLAQPRKKQKHYENFMANCALKNYKQQIDDLFSPFNIELSDESLPKIICTQCYEFLPKFFDFHTKCVNSNKTLKDIHLKISAAIKSEDSIKEEEEADAPEIFTEAVKVIEQVLPLEAPPPIILKPLSPKCESDTQEEEEEAYDEASDNDGSDDYDGRTDGENLSQADGDKAGKAKRKPRQCNVCGKIVHRLPIHMLSHTKEKKHQCQYCERSFSTKGNLATHTDIHLNNRKYKCHICPKDFVSSSSFRKHLLVHSGTRNHHCDLCDKSFNQVYTLRMHKKMHAQDRPNECTVCKKKFYTAFQLRQHHKTHGAKLKCNQCDKEFKTKIYLEIHQRTHSGDSPYNCHLCCKKFSSGSSLANHAKTHARKLPAKRFVEVDETVVLVATQTLAVNNS